MFLRSRAVGRQGLSFQVKQRLPLGGERPRQILSIQRCFMFPVYRALVPWKFLKSVAVFSKHSKIMRESNSCG
jgi:hypothetical protein